VGSSGEGAFVLDTATGEVTRHVDTASAVARFSPPPKLQTPDQFYRARRFGWQDVAALLVLVGMAGAVSRLWYSRLIRARAPARATA
jgi:hypothetical protein